ncbi:MAG: hypothetical protein HRT98_00445 [Mycoplasmatales bacterium]|nr:hypothetical protein [Mycoplasmatales bacterium]
MKLLRSKKIKIGLLTAVMATVPIVTTSCNMDFSKEQKDMHLDKKDFDSKEYAIIQKTIQTSIQDSMFKKYYSNQVINNSYATKDVDGEWKVKGKEKEYSSMRNIITETDARRFFINEQWGGTGNYGAGLLWEAIDDIRENSLVSKETHLLLNKMSTIYNRTIVIYPTKVFVKNGEFIKGEKATAGKYLHAEFRADLQTPMKRRFMKKFMTLKINVPIDNSSKTDDPSIEMKRLKAIEKIKDAKSVKTIGQLKEILNETILSGKKTVNSSKHSIIDDGAFNKMFNVNKNIDLNGGIYPLNKTKNGVYTPEWTGKVNLENGKITTQKNNVEQIYNFGFWNTTKDEELNKTFKGSEKVSKITDFIKQKMFVESEQPIIKDLFSKDGNWDVEVLSRTWAGNKGSNYFISDWIENLGHRTNYFYYFKNKNDASQTFYVKGGSSLNHPKEGN